MFIKSNLEKLKLFLNKKIKFSSKEFDSLPEKIGQMFKRIRNFISNSFHMKLDRIKDVNINEEVTIPAKHLISDVMAFLESRQFFHVLILISCTLVLAINIVNHELISNTLNSDVINSIQSNVTLLSWVAFLLFSLYLSHSIQWNMVGKLSVSYFIYLFISYGLLITQNLNNKDFDINNYLENTFFETNGLLFILPIVVFSGLIHLFVRKEPYVIKRIYNFFRIDFDIDIILGLLVSLIVIFDSKLLSNLNQFLFLSNEEELYQFIRGISYKIPIIILSVTTITTLFWKAIQQIRKNKPSYSLTVIMSLLFAFIFNYTIQYGIRMDETLYEMNIFPGATLFQILFLTLLYLFIYSIFNSFWLPTVLILFTGISLSIANSIKYQMRSEPVLLTDLRMLSDLELIFGFLNGNILLLSLFLVVGLITLYYFLKKRYLRGKVFVKFPQRFLAVVVSFFAFFGILNVFSNQKNGLVPDDIPVLTRLNNSHNVMFAGFSTSARFQSLMYLWVKQLTTPVMEPIDGYSPEAIQFLVEKYTQRAQEINKTRKESIQDQTVIFILSESFSDPTRLPGVNISENVLENIKNIANPTTSGLMKSDVYGGGTANIETQTLVGLPLYNLSSSIGIYNVQVVPKMNVVPSISDAFLPENRTVIHLGETKLYSRAEVYNTLDFGTFIANDAKAKQPSVSVNLGKFPSDASTYQNVLDNLDPNKNQFFSVITYQNHIPWSMSEPAELYGKGEGFTPQEDEKLSHYARLLKSTDTATKDFFEKLKKVDKDITVVFYGDHLPGLYPNSLFEQNPENKYLTDYFIWNNKKNTKLNYPLVNSSDFPAAVLAQSNSKVSAYYALLTDVLENASVDKTDLTEEQKIIADDLKMLQYDIVAGKGYIKDYDEFFSFSDR